jgi:hypothetical protein
VIRTANFWPSGVATIQPSYRYAEMPSGRDDRRLKFRPAILWDGVGIEDRDGHEWYYRGSCAAGKWQII